MKQIVPGKSRCNSKSTMRKKIYVVSISDSFNKRLKGQNFAPELRCIKQKLKAMTSFYSLTTQESSPELIGTAQKTPPPGMLD